MDDLITEGGFFQFPLCLLSTREPVEIWLRRAFHYGVIEFLYRTSEGDLPHAVKSRTEKLRCFENARKVIRFRSGDYDEFIQSHDLARSRINFWKHKNGQTFEVRLKTEYYHEMLSQQMLPEREFRVLLGIYSMIGPKSFAKVGWPMMQARAAGYLRPGDPATYIGQVYSRGQIERACTELLDRGFVTSITYNRGERFWSNSLSLEQLGAKVQQRKTATIQRRLAREELSAKTSAAIMEANRKTLLTCSPPVRDLPAASPSGAQPEQVSLTSSSTSPLTSPSTLQESVQ